MRYFQNNKKPLLLFLTFICLAFVSGVYLRRQSDNGDKNISANQPAAIINQNKPPVNLATSPEPSFSSNISLNTIKATQSQPAAAAASSVKTSPASSNAQSPPPLVSKSPRQEGERHALYVGDKKYEIAIPEHRTVYDLMISLKQRGDFDFRGRASSGLGFFVEEINGVKNNAKVNLFWIYYINGKKADSGISSYILKPNDIIDWKYEKPQY